MTRMTEDDLVLYYYGELSEEARLELERLLEADFELRKRYSRLCQVLNTVDGAETPAPDTEFESRIWAGVETNITARPGALPGRLRRWLGAVSKPGAHRGLTPLAASLVLIAVAAAYFAGRSVGPNGISVEAPPVADSRGTVGAAPFSETARQRVLHTSVSEHLERSGRLLKQVVNVPAGSRGEATTEQQLAESRVAYNRVYRTAAERSGEVRIVNMLDLMEPILLELARRPNSYAGSDLDVLQQRIEENDLLFKVRATRAGLKHPRAADSSAGQETI